MQNALDIRRNPLAIVPYTVIVRYLCGFVFHLGRSVGTSSHAAQTTVVRREHRLVQEMGRRPLVLLGSDCRLVPIDAGTFLSLIRRSFVRITSVDPFTLKCVLNFYFYCFFHKLDLARR